MIVSMKMGGFTNNGIALALNKGHKKHDINNRWKFSLELGYDPRSHSDY
jgi:hypothetical protein